MTLNSLKRVDRAVASLSTAYTSSLEALSVDEENDYPELEEMAEKMRELLTQLELFRKKECLS